MFEPLELDRANELNDLINQAGESRQAVVIDPEEEGLTGLTPPETNPPEERLNGLARFQRHY